MWFVGTWMFFPVINSMMVFSADRVVVRKELYVGAYRLSAYYIARVTTILPFEFFKAWVFNTIVYCITLPGDASFAQYALLCSAIWLSMTSFYAVGLTISAGVPERHVMTVSIILITFFFGYSGFFVPFDQVPIWLRWVEHGNLFNCEHRDLHLSSFRASSSPPPLRPVTGALFDRGCRNAWTS